MIMRGKQLFITEYRYVFVIIVSAGYQEQDSILFEQYTNKCTPIRRCVVSTGNLDQWGT